MFKELYQSLPDQSSANYDQLPRDTKQVMNKVLTMLARTRQAGIHNVLGLGLENLLNRQAVHAPWTKEQMAMRKKATDNMAPARRQYGTEANQFRRPGQASSDDIHGRQGGSSATLREWAQPFAMCQMLAFLTPFAAWYFCLLPW